MRQHAALLCPGGNYLDLTYVLILFLEKFSLCGKSSLIIFGAKLKEDRLIKNALKNTLCFVFAKSN